MLYSKSSDIIKKNVPKSLSILKSFPAKKLNSFAWKFAPWSLTIKTDKLCLKFSNKYNKNSESELSIYLTIASEVSCGSINDNLKNFLSSL